MSDVTPPFVSRAGQKLDHALTTFELDVSGRVCADLGCNVGGFVDCMLRRGVAKVYAVDTGYGVLDYRLRKDARVVVMERTNAMHVSLPEPVGLVTIDVAWTKQRNILPAARRLLGEDAQVITLIKPHYEAAPSQLRGGVLMESALEAVLNAVEQEIRTAGFDVLARTQSPIKGGKGNVEFLALLQRADLISTATPPAATSRPPG
jgi:23S rRNA (cytidine1920-2'-O)/16S rRNA (cytidine1409-2'-O)-methyltransferase